MGNSGLTKSKSFKGNPFIYNAPVRGEDFYNRDEIIGRLMKETVTGRSQGNVWITGERQVGKTSLLRYIQTKHECENGRAQLYDSEAKDYFNTALIYLNVQDNKTRNHFYRNLQQSLKNFFDFKLESLDDPFKNYVNTLKHLYFNQKYYIVFLLDEFDAFIENLADQSVDEASVFLTELNKMIQGVSDLKNEPKVFGCIFTANHTIEDLMKENDIKRRGSGLVVESLELPWFSGKQIEELAQQYLEDNPIQFSSREIDFCYKMTQGYPYFVQKLFSIMYDHKVKEPKSRNYLKAVREEYGETFKETVKGWGGESMPRRTFEKLKNLAGPIIKNVAPDLMGKVIAESLKKLFNI
jgi:hypothetical protein